MENTSHTGWTNQSYAFKFDLYCMLENPFCSSELQGLWSLYLKVEIKNYYPVPLFANVSAWQFKYKWQVPVKGISVHWKQKGVGKHTSRPDLAAHEGQGKGAWAPPAQPVSWGSQDNEKDQQHSPPSAVGRHCAWSEGGQDQALRSDVLCYRYEQTAPSAPSELQKHVLNFVS